MSNSNFFGMLLRKVKTTNTFWFWFFRKLRIPCSSNKCFYFSCKLKWEHFPFTVQFQSMYSDFGLFTQKLVKNLQYHELYEMLSGHSPFSLPKEQNPKIRAKYLRRRMQTQLSYLSALLGPHYKALLFSWFPLIQTFTQVSSEGEESSLWWHPLVCMLTKMVCFICP